MYASIARAQSCPGELLCVQMRQPGSPSPTTAAASIPLPDGGRATATALRSMRSRAEALGGRLEVDFSTRSGRRVEVHVPMGERWQEARRERDIIPQRYGTRRRGDAPAPHPAG